MPDVELMRLARAIAGADDADATGLLDACPELATKHFEGGATRQVAQAYFLDEIGHYIYAGDTALHVAAAAHRQMIARKLIAMGARVRVRNRRGAEPLHYAADSRPGSLGWSADEQAATVTCLIAAGADPNALDNSGVAPLHRAVRTRGAAAVTALLDGGADPRLKNKSGSTPMLLATHKTGRGGSGSRDAKAEQEQIVALLKRHLDQ